jgi:hypothetical protein
VFSKLKLSESSNDPKKEAEYAFYNQNYEKAVTLLQDYVKENPHDYAARASLANAYMASSGLDIIDLALDFKKIDKNKNESHSDFLSFLIDEFPENTGKTKKNLASAIQNFNVIPKKKLLNEQKYYKGILYIFQTVLLLKDNGIQKSNDLTKEKLQKLKSDGVLKALDSNFQAAKEVTQDSSNGPISKAINKISENIDKEAGESREDKILDYLSSLKKN